MKTTFNEDKLKLIKHVTKLQGQLDSVKRELEKDVPDCEKTSATLYAASRSFASVRTIFMKCFLTKEFLKESRDEKRLDQLLTLIKG
ncbi:metal-sensing transcriptional repressor [Patescibacteria group bacterium]|nr:metal-sensing transcriptional repressor [Patescibacteria group bacterium]